MSSRLSQIKIPTISAMGPLSPNNDSTNTSVIESVDGLGAMGHIDTNLSLKGIMSNYNGIDSARSKQTNNRSPKTSARSHESNSSNNSLASHDKTARINAPVMFKLPSLSLPHPQQLPPLKHLKTGDIDDSDEEVAKETFSKRDADQSHDNQSRDTTSQDEELSQLFDGFSPHYPAHRSHNHFNSTVNSPSNIHHQIVSPINKPKGKNYLNINNPTRYMFDIQQSVQKAKQFKESGKLDIAITFYDAVITSVLRHHADKNHMRSGLNLSELYDDIIDCYIRTHDFQQALRFSMEYLHEFPYSFSPYYLTSLCHKESKNFRDAIKFCNRGLDKFQCNALLFSLRGSIYLEMQEYQQAVHDYHKCREYSRVDGGEPVNSEKAFRTWIPNTRK